MKGAFITHLGCGRAARRGDNRTAKPATLSSMIFPGEMYQASRFARCTTWEEEKKLQRICEATYQHLGFGVQSRASSRVGFGFSTAGRSRQRPKGRIGPKLILFIISSRLQRDQSSYSQSPCSPPICSRIKKACRVRKKKGHPELRRPITRRHLTIYHHGDTPAH